MKLWPATADPDAVPHGLKGVQVRDTPWGWIAQKRPGPRKTPPTKLQQLYRQRFALAARMAANPHGLELAAATEMAKGTDQVPRDLLTQAALGRFWELVNEDGTAWGHVDGPVVDSDLGHEPEPEPEPEPTTEDDVYWTQYYMAWNTPNSSSAYCFKGTQFTPREARTVNRVLGILQTVNGATYAAALGKIGSLGEIETLTLSEPVLATRAAHQLLAFEVAHDLEVGALHFLMIGRTDSSGTYALPCHFAYPAQWLWPCDPGPAVRLSNPAPAVGDPLNLLTDNTSPPLGLRFA